MPHWFYATLHDEETGAITISEMECWIEAEVNIVGGLPEIEVTDVLVNGEERFGRLVGATSLWKGDPFTRQLAAKITSLAEDEIARRGSLYDRIIDDAGVVYRGLGGNDPDGQWVAA